MVDIELILRGIVLPAVVTLVVLALASRPWRRRRERGPGWAAPVAIGGGFLAGFAALFGWPGLPPGEHWQRIIYIGCLAIVAGAVETTPRRAAALRWLVRVAVIGIIAWGVVPDWKELADTRMVWMAVAGGMVCFGWVSLRRAGRSGRTLSPLVSLFVIVSAISLVMLQSRNARLAQAAGVLAAAIAASGVACGWKRAGLSWGAAAPVIASLATALALNGWFYNYGAVPVASFVLAGLSPASVGLCGMGAIGRLSGWKRWAVDFAIAVAPVGVAVGLAMVAPSETLYEGY